MARGHLRPLPVDSCLTLGRRADNVSDKGLDIHGAVAHLSSPLGAQCRRRWPGEEDVGEGRTLLVVASLNNAEMYREREECPVWLARNGRYESSGQSVFLPSRCRRGRDVVGWLVDWLADMTDDDVFADTRPYHGLCGLRVG